MGSLVVTTSRNPHTRLTAAAQAWADRLNTRFAPRHERGLATVVGDEQVTGVLVISAQPPVYYEPAQDLQYFFHPNMARTRIHNIKAGRGDPIITSMRLGPGDSVLDCTLGRGSDAIVASWVVAENGQVVGVESVPVLAALAAHGLDTYEIKPDRLRMAMRHIEVHCADYHDFLRDCAPRSFDVVYFDPIFDQPLEASQAIEPLRAIGDDQPVDILAIEEACRVAHRVVVIKQRRGSDYWQRLPGDVDIIGGSSSRIEYGVIRLN